MYSTEVLSKPNVAEHSELTELVPYDSVSSTPSVDHREHSAYLETYPGFPQTFPTPFSMPPHLLMMPFSIPTSFSSENYELSSNSVQGGGPIRNLPFTEKDDSETLMEVPGRLCLLSASTSYKVKMNEIKRRIGTPECMNLSYLAGILRKGKAKDNVKNLKTELSSRGIDIPSGRRKTAAVTGFTALCEEEAIRLSHQWREVCTRESGHAIIGQSLTEQALSKGTSLQNWMTDLQGFMSVMGELSKMYNAVPEHPDDIDPKTEAEHSINRFSLLSHGFGHNALKVANDLYANIGNEAMAQCQEYRVPFAQSQMMQPPFF